MDSTRFGAHGAVRDNPVVEFTCTAPTENLLIPVSLNHVPFANRYVITTDSSWVPASGWQQALNSDAQILGGGNEVGDGEATLEATALSIFQTAPDRWQRQQSPGA
jgi:hypothetical protein